jgi:hypothetical protein
MATLRQRTSRLAPWGLVLAVPAMMVLGIWLGADAKHGELWKFWEGPYPPLIQYFYDLPVELFYLLIGIGTLGLALTFLHRFWWLAGCAAYSLSYEAQNITYKYLDKQIGPGHAYDGSYPMLFFIFNPLLMAGILALLTHGILYLIDKRISVWRWLFDESYQVGGSAPPS